MSFKKHPLVYILVPLCVIAMGVSYHRFLIAEAYTVSYEGACDPITESCFVGCEDELCTEPYYYTLIERSAADVRQVCGPDLSECDYASACGPSDSDCTVTHCSVEALAVGESCEEFDESDAEAFAEEDIPADGSGPDEVNLSEESNPES